MSKGGYDEMMKKKREKAEKQKAEDARQKADKDAVNQFIQGASYGDSNTVVVATTTVPGNPVVEKKDRRKKAAEDKGKAFTFYMQEKYSDILNKKLDDFPRSETISRSDLLKVGISLVSNLTAEQIKTHLDSLNKS